MNLFNLFSDWKKRRCREPDATAMAEAIVVRYRQCRARGAFRVDDRLYRELSELMPEKVAQRIHREFCTRRAHGHPGAENTLRQEIVTALLDAEHFASTTKPVNRAAPPNPVAGGSIRQRAQAKVLAGQPLTDEEEDAMLWS